MNRRRVVATRNRAWIADMGEHGDFTRRFVLDPVMTGRIAGRGFATALSAIGTAR